jgi:hypothetical protein
MSGRDDLIERELEGGGEGGRIPVVHVRLEAAVEKEGDCEGSDEHDEDECL